MLICLIVVFSSVAYYAYKLDPEVNAGVAMTIFALSIAAFIGIIFVMLGFTDAGIEEKDHLSDPPIPDDRLDPIDAKETPESLRKRNQPEGDKSEVALS